MFDIDIGLSTYDEDATLYSGLMPPVETPGGTRTQFNMPSHSILNTPLEAAVLHHNTSSMDMTTAASSIVNSNQVIGFSDDFHQENGILLGHT
jgi:hypothetical protein